MASRTLLSALLILVVSVVAAFLFNEIVADAQHEPGTGQTTDCPDPGPFWGNFERCEGQEEHLFWMAGLTAVVAAGTAALTERAVSHATAQRPGSRARWVVLAAALAFVGVVLWGFLFDIHQLQPDFY